MRQTHQLMRFLAIFSLLSVNCGLLVVGVPYKFWNIQLTMCTKWGISAAFWQSNPPHDVYINDRNCPITRYTSTRCILVRQQQECCAVWRWLNFGCTLVQTGPTGWHHCQGKRAKIADHIITHLNYILTDMIETFQNCQHTQDRSSGYCTNVQ